jgi:photosystem II stability/assembly factor-like uncharacterized protein
MFYFTNKNKLYYFAALLFLIAFGSLASNAQFADMYDHPEFFGLKKSLYTNRVTKAVYDDKNYIYVSIWGTGVYNSTDVGKTWKSLNSGLTNFYVADMIISNSGAFILTTKGSGIFRSVNKGQTWTQINTGLNHLDVKCVNVFKNGWLLAGTYGGGVYISKDDGNKWTQINNGLRYRDINAIAFSAAGYFVAATNGGGIYASRDSGKTWKTQNTGLTNFYINDLKLNKTGSLFAASNGRGVLQSPNDGLSWAELDTFMIRPYTINHSPLPDLNATKLIFNKNDKVLFSSRYGGAFVYDDVEDFAWIPSDIRGNGVNALLSDKYDSLWAFPASKVPLFSDGIGDVWTDKPEIATAKSPKLLILAKNKLLMYDKTGSFYLSTDDGDTWQAVANIGQWQIHSVSKDSSGNLFAATDNGLYVSDMNAANWTPIRFQDSTVFDVQIAPNGRIWAVTYQLKVNPPPQEPSVYRNVFVSTDNCVTWTDKTPDLSKVLENPQKIVITYNNLLYIGLGNFFYYSIDNGTNWKASNQLGASNQVLDLCVGKNNIMYFATYQGIYKTTSPGAFAYIPTVINNNSIIHLDKNDVIYASGSYNDPDNFFSKGCNITYRTSDLGATCKVLNNSYNAEQVTSITSNADGDIYMTTASGSFYKSMNPANLKAPVLANIPDNAYDIPNNPIFSWGKAENAELYQIQLSIDQDFIYDFETVTFSDSSYQIQNTFFPNTKFWWRVRSKNHAALSPWSEARTFITKLAAPTLVAPDSNGVGVSVYANLIWNMVDGASKYDLLLSKSKNFNDTVMFAKDLADTAKITIILDGLTTYYWKARAKNDKSTSLWSNIWQFNTVVGPPRLMSPADKEFGVKTEVNFKWHKAIQATSYYIQITTIADFSGFFHESSVNDTIYPFSGLNYDIVYYWRVRSENKDGVSEFSEPWSFRTGYAPVVLKLPKNDSANLKIPVTLKWQKHETQNIYELQLAQDSLFTKDFQKFENIDSLLEFTPSGLKYFTFYFWRMRVTSSENTGLWSEIRKFRTILGKSGLRIPADQSKGQPISLSFLWYILQGAHKYHLQIANDGNFQDLVFSQDTITNYSMDIKDLQANSTFYWRVRGVNMDFSVNDYGEWSDVWSFSTGGKGPELISPANGAEKIKIPLKFTWNYFENTNNYKLQVAKESTFNNIVAGGDAITGTEFNITTLVLEPSTSYYWHLQANLTDGSTSTWSQTWGFTTDPVLPVKDLQITDNSNSYPNPFKDYTTITFAVNTYSKASIKIIDMSGRTINFAELGILIPGNHKYFWNPKELSEGVYYYIINLDKETIQGELIKE